MKHLNESNRKKIVFLFHNLSYGGACKSMTFWANALAESGHEIHILLYRNANKPVFMIDSSIVIHENSNKKNNKIREIYFMYSVLKKINPTLIIGVMNVNGFFSVLFSKIFGTKSIVSERGSPLHDNNILGKIKKLVMSFSDGLIFQTNGAMNLYNKRVLNKSLILMNPATTHSDYIPFNDKNDELIFTARSEIKQKRHDLAIRFIAELIKDGIQVKLNIYGDGPDQENIFNLIEEQNLQRNVILHGAKNDMQNEFEKFKFMIFTSDYEGMPNALIEAMLSGCICIATKCSPGGAEELINHGVNGFLVNQGDVDSMVNIFKDLKAGIFNLNAISINARKLSTTLDPLSIKECLINYVNKI